MGGLVDTPIGGEPGTAGGDAGCGWVPFILTLAVAIFLIGLALAGGSEAPPDGGVIVPCLFF